MTGLWSFKREVQGKEGVVYKTSNYFIHQHKNEEIRKTYLKIGYASFGGR